MGSARKLYQLQQLELEIEAGQSTRDRLEGQLNDRRALDEAAEKLASAQQCLEGLRHEQHDAEWGIEDLSAKLEADKETLYSGRIKSPKELAGLQHETEGLKARKDRLEEQALQIMERAERTEADVASRSHELEKRQEEWRLKQQGLSAEIEQLDKTLVKLKDRRELLVAEIGQEVASLYYELKKYKGRAVAAVEQGVCRGCSLSLSSAWLQRARGSELVRCSSCGRILFLE